MVTPAHESPLRRRFGVTLLAGLPGILALAGYIYLTTPQSAIPAGLSRPLLAVLSGVNSLLFLAVACLVGAFAAPRVGLRSYLVDRAGTGDRIWPRLRDEVRLAVSVGILGGLLVLVLDVALAPFVAQDIPSREPERFSPRCSTCSPTRRFDSSTVALRRNSCCDSGSCPHSCSSGGSSPVGGRVARGRA
ncbi:hypothetical protein [Haladaptatus sp. DYSN1]|uniref:hypothetical protein n=1 Tax=unclassified Haladaptatus TaxID=2622732 RepID=UPI002405B33D|nr:hypothetical protein [Haladaptatus sp. DYSN1]